MRKGKSDAKSLLTLRVSIKNMHMSSFQHMRRPQNNSSIGTRPQWAQSTHIIYQMLHAFCPPRRRSLWVSVRTVCLVEWVAENAWNTQNYTTAWWLTNGQNNPSSCQLARNRFLLTKNILKRTTRWVWPWIGAAWLDSSCAECLAVAMRVETHWQGFFNENGQKADFLIQPAQC